MVNDLNILLGPDYVPEGEYSVCLYDMSLNLTKDKDHSYILAYFKILDGAFYGRKLKQIWSFRRGQEQQTNVRINNYYREVTGDEINATNDTIYLKFNEIQSKLLNKEFIVRLIKRVDTRYELVYALKAKALF